MKRNNRPVHVGAFLFLVVLVLLVTITSSYFGKFRGDITGEAAEQTVATVFVPFSSSDVVNEDGNSFSSSGSRWLGTGQNVNQSYLGLYLKGSNVPLGATIKSAKLEFTQPRTQWLPVSFAVYTEKNSSPQAFSGGNRPSKRQLSGKFSAYSDNVKWEAGKAYSYDVTAPVQEFFSTYGGDTVALIVKGTGKQWGRKFVFESSGSVKLEVVYVVSSSTIVPTSTPSITNPPATVTPTAVVTATSQPSPTSTGSGIFGVVGADTLGTCFATVHDKYVTVGPDGKMYRTWHPVQDTSGCTFGHEHGDDPSRSTIYTGNPVPFGYIASNLGMDEPHVGFKCFVHNKGTKNDESGVMLHDAYYCFHMGTGGTARYTARFHSIEFHAKSSDGTIMNLGVMADVGNVGSICDNPRQQRTVQALGCLIDSAYEIWANNIRIVNGGSTLAFVQVSTAVFDPITSMDPKDKSRVIYSWSQEAQQKIFKFTNDRAGFRGCDREAYTGPMRWSNRGGSKVYYTDAYGNVVNGGPLKQEVSDVNISTLVMAYKGGNTGDPQTQFKYRKSACVPGLGIKN